MPTQTMSRRLLAVAATSLLVAIEASAQTRNAGRDIAAGCASCHSQNIALGKIPSLAGLGKAELVARLIEFKSGRRAGTVMPQLAKGYTDEQIELVATWLSSESTK
jgi:sulfide dehydrogenase cytochrome subunit